MLRPIIGDLGLVLPDGLDDAAWIVNAYLIAYIAVMPIAGRLSDVIGRRRTFLGAYALFLAGSIVIPLTSSLGPFLVGRVLTALGGGAMVPVALAVIGDVYSERGRARALGTLGAIDTFGWVWGPMYGAVLVRFLSWQWQFWLNIPLAIVGMAAVWWALADHDRPARGLARRLGRRRAADGGARLAQPGAARQRRDPERVGPRRADRIGRHRPALAVSGRRRSPRSRSCGTSAAPITRWSSARSSAVATCAPRSSSTSSSARRS